MASGAKGRRFKSCRAHHPVDRAPAGAGPSSRLGDFLRVIPRAFPRVALIVFLLPNLLVLLLPLATLANPRPAAYLLEGTGARDLGLGSATTALADDITALRANPAGLAFVDDYQGNFEVGHTHSRDVWASAAVAVPFQRRTTFGVGISGTRLNGELGRTRLGNDYAYHLDAAAREEQQGVLDLAASRLLRPDLAVGVAARYASTRQGRAGESLYEGVYGTVGVRYNSAQTGIVAGLVLENVGGRLSGARDPEIPWTLRGGLSYGLMVRTAHYVNVAADVVKMDRRDPAVRAGVEYWFANYLGLRLGWDMMADRAANNSYGGRFSAGLSLNFRGVLYDFAIVPARGDLRDARIAAGARVTFGEGRSDR